MGQLLHLAWPRAVQLVTEYLERLRHVGINRLNFMSK